MREFTDIHAIVTDIEGTTSSLSFVKDELFPYARARLGDYVQKHPSKVRDILNQVRVLENNQTLTAEQIVAVFERWMDEDKKATPLKTLQGLIWQEGYQAGELRGHIYEDAADALRRWHAQGLRLYIYSSGSVAAQKLLFGHTDEGDLTPLFSGYFDTTTGPKLESFSYRTIANDINTAPGHILFLSDHAGEISAAQEAGFQTRLIDRAKDTFDDIIIRRKAA